jgi:hypothetical protein
MKIAAIQKRKDRSAVKFDTAVQIRQLIDVREKEWHRLVRDDCDTLENQLWENELLTADIDLLRSRSSLKYDTAVQLLGSDTKEEEEIRDSAILDAARKKYGKDWEDNGVEDEIVGLVIDMDVKAILNRKAAEEILYDTAIQIRQILEAARKAYGPSDWDGDDLDAQVLELVTEE